jgi:hypothetical protein
LKRGIVHSRILVRECLMETERSARQWQGNDMELTSLIHEYLQLNK